MNKNRKDKREDPVYEDVTIVKRVIERTLIAEKVYVSVQAKHNLALRAEYLTWIDLIFDVKQTIESLVQRAEYSLNERDTVNVSKDEIILSKQN